MKEKLFALRNTLNQIEVRGETNLDMLLGCIQTVAALIAEQNEEENHAEDCAE